MSSNMYKVILRHKDLGFSYFYGYICVSSAPKVGLVLD